MSDDRSELQQDYNSLTAKINSSYAKKWNYDFLYIKTEQCFSPKGSARHPAWAKLLSTKKVVLESNYELVVYIDSDCIFKDHNISIEEYLKIANNVENKPLRQRTITFLNDIPWSDKLPCSGFYVVRGKDVAIFEDWFNCELPDYDLKHPWEQKALYNTILSKWSNNIEIINDVMFLEKEGQFLRHIGSSEASKRIPYFENYIKVHNIR